MVETLNELNKQTIKDGFLLSDGQSLRKDFSEKLGQDLTVSENHIYCVIHNLTKIDITGIIPASVGEIYMSNRNPRTSSQVTNCDIHTIEALVHRIREKLGEMAIKNTHSLGKCHCGYFSRTRAIDLMIESNFY